MVEFLGNEELLHVSVGDHDLVAIVDASRRVRPGDVLDLWVPLEKIHLFDADEGHALAKAAPDPTRLQVCQAPSGTDGASSLRRRRER